MTVPAALTHMEKIAVARYDLSGDRYCLRCKTYVPPSFFRRDPNGANGLRAYCTQCETHIPKRENSLRRAASYDQMTRGVQKK